MMLLRVLTMLLCLLCISASTFTQVKKITAVKVTDVPKLDGFLTDTIWQNAATATDFIVNNPNYGAPASHKTIVKLVYTDEALYVGAYLYDKPDSIRKQLTSRDAHDRQDCDFFTLSIDTYRDRQNAFQFVVTTANVQSDARVSTGGERTFDYNWDAVWDSRVAMQPDGWTVEIKIPYMSIRFAKAALQQWGINFGRNIRRTNEVSYWNPINPQQAGFVNQFGDLVDIVNIVPPLRLSFLPYVTGGYQTIPTNKGTQTTWIRNGGMDVKYGINESFTLDMTLIPDFGQVVSDNVILNLSPFEQQFQENRPFFTEGTELFNKAGIFYSRRVGERPPGYFTARAIAADSNYQLVKNPSTQQLYNASKFSGRNKGNLGIGVFNAVTAPTYAIMRNSKGEDIKLKTADLTNYNIVVLDQALKHRSSVTFTNTNTWRAGGERNANVAALDISLFDSTNTYNVRAQGRLSNVWGTRGNYNGFASFVSVGKVSGRWQWNLYNNIESDRYDPNDLGILFAPNEISTGGELSYIQFVPNKHFNYRNYTLSIDYQSLYKPASYQEVSVNANFLHVFKNFWDVSLEISSNPFYSYDYFELRTPGTKMRKVPWAFAGLFGSTDSRKKLFVSYGLGFAESPIENDPFYLARMGVRYRFNPKFSLEVSKRWEDDQANYGFSHFDPTTRVPIIGRRRIKQATTLVSGLYNFKARMNVSLRLRHYWSNVNYESFFTVSDGGDWLPTAFSANRNRNFNVFNIDMFYTWDFLLGSRLIIAWKNALGPDVVVDGTRHGKYTQNLWETLRSPQSNEVSVRLIYFVDYNSLRKRKQVG